MAYQLNIDGVYNMRDLGGYPTADGGVTRRGVFVRSGVLTELSPAAQQQIIDYGITTIIDLRNEDELVLTPNSFTDSTVVRYHHLPIVGQELAATDRWQTVASIYYPELHDYYAQHLPICTEKISAIMSALIDSPDAVLFHCYAGKDRTGMITGLLLGAVGVPDAIIGEDYALTGAGIAHLVTTWRENAIKNGDDMAIFERGVASKAETMLELMRHIRQNYGGAAEYLRTVGITDEQIARLRARFVEYPR